MKPVRAFPALVAGLVLSACQSAPEPEGIPPTPSANYEQLCAGEAAQQLGVPMSAVRAGDSLGSSEGTAVKLFVNGRTATCRVDASGNITSVDWD